MKNRLSIYVSSPDSYADVFKVFYKGYRKYWVDCPYIFYLTTNTQQYEGLNCICNNKVDDSWVERTIAALPQITSKYLLVMCDDLIICDRINNREIEAILDYMDAHQIRYCRLDPLPFGNLVTECPLIRKVNQQTPYAINLQIGIYRKDYFIELLGDGTSTPWEIESNVNENASKALDIDFNDIIVTSKPIIPYIHGVYKGKWINRSVKRIVDLGIADVFQRERVDLLTEWKIRLITWLQWRISPETRKRLKTVLKSIGVKFTTNF